MDLDDTTRVSQSALSEYAIFQFKNYVGGYNACTLTWNGQTNIPCSTSTVFLEIYNRVSPGWDAKTFDDSHSENDDFNLTVNVPDLTNYKDAQNLISCRVYQEAK